MVRPWLVRLELARDDDGSLSDEGLEELKAGLAEGSVDSVVTRGDSGTIHVRMTFEAANDQAAKSAAQTLLRDRAQALWSRLGLPPFTITFVDAQPQGEP
jgi:hypothetical protein